MTDLEENDHKISQCNFYVQRKHRFCRMTVKPGNNYCGEHSPAPKNVEIQDLRVACPLDPKHTCFLSKLKKHVLVCNAREQDKAAYYQHNINVLPGENPMRIPLSEVPQGAVDAVIDKINTLFLKLLSSAITVCSDPDIHPSVVPEFSVKGRSETSLRHLRQASSLLWRLRDQELLGKDFCYVELGAGKGRLSQLVGDASGGQVVAIERGARRYKREGPGADRLRADLAHVALEHTPVGGSRAVGLAKHLCGDATDLAIRCMTRPEVCDQTKGLLIATCCHHRCLPANYVGASYLKELGVTVDDLNIIFGIVSWATCGTRFDSGRDTYSEETAKMVPNEETKPNLIHKEQNISNVKQCATIVPNQEAGDKTNGESEKIVSTEITEQKIVTSKKTMDRKEEIERREEVGRRAKALLDYGRVLYLRDRGFQAQLTHFVDKSVTLENVCIVAKKL